MEEIVLSKYKDFNYPSADVLYKILKKENIDVTLKEVRSIIQKQTAHQIHKETTAKVQSNLVAFNFNEIILADLIDFMNIFLC